MTAENPRLWAALVSSTFERSKSVIPEPPTATSSPQDQLAYELRRLARALVAQRTTSHVDAQAAQPGPLALQLASSFGLRGIDVDLALTVLGIEIDHEFASLVVDAGLPTEKSLLAALVPQLEHRLLVLDAIGHDAPSISAGLLRRTERNGAAVLHATRRFRTAVLGQPLLSSLPTFAHVSTMAPAVMPWTVAPAGLLDAMVHARAGSLCLVSGEPGVGKSTWAAHAAHRGHASVLRIDAARAACGREDTVLDIEELLEDAALAGVPTIIDNADELLEADPRLSLIIEDALATTPIKMFVVGAGGDGIHRLSRHALGHVRIDAPPADVRRGLWRPARAEESVRNGLAEELVLTPRQISHALTLIEAGAEPAAAAFEQIAKGRRPALPEPSGDRISAVSTVQGGQHG